VARRRLRTAVRRADQRGYRRFWHGVGANFPSLTGAASTRFYLDNETRLLGEHLPGLQGDDAATRVGEAAMGGAEAGNRAGEPTAHGGEAAIRAGEAATRADNSGPYRLLKTDLWDEAKNTRILQWAARRGARVYGIDLSRPIVEQARDAFGDEPLRGAFGGEPLRAAFGGEPLRASLADVRELPFAGGSFDAIYSMGTIEHFAESESAVVEMARVLRPGGRLVLGVPNRHDPFLRPLLVVFLRAFGLYAYGSEKSYSRRALRRMLEAAGLEVVAETGILFIPGWLRMLDLLAHTRLRPLERITAPAVALFAWLDRRFPSLRRHGYLLASVAVRPR